MFGIDGVASVAYLSVRAGHSRAHRECAGTVRGDGDLVGGQATGAFAIAHAETGGIVLLEIHSNLDAGSGGTVREGRHVGDPSIGVEGDARIHVHEERGLSDGAVRIDGP
jgi:hypothetical protein